MKRKCDQLRKIEIIRNFTKHAAGSVLIKWGDTWVLCTASVEEKVPPFLKDTGKGWVTAEYSMLPGSTGGGRKDRDIKKLKQDARSTEIQRLIGRSLRAAVDITKLGERQITIDCDVLQADGGTRCASITGGMVALQDAIDKLLSDGKITENPIVHRVAAVSVGICDGKPTLDLDYIHDSTAEVDLNVVMTDDGRYVELQGTAEHNPFTEDSLDALRSLAKKGLSKIFKLMRCLTLLVFMACMFAVADDGTAALKAVDRSREKGWWMPRHEKTVELITNGAKEYDIVLIGDSITDFWSKSGAKPWHEKFGEAKTLNLGVMGDRIENIYWRLINGQGQGWKAKTIMLLAGTNNIGKRASGEKVAALMEGLVKYLRESHPEAKIVLVKIFPRADNKAGANAKERIDEANRLTEKLIDGVNIVKLDIRQSFLNDDGSLKEELFKDKLHPNESGYRIWAAAAFDVINNL